MTEQILHDTPAAAPSWFHDEMFKGCASFGPASHHLASIARAAAGLNGVSHLLRIDQVLEREDGFRPLSPSDAENLYCAQAALIAVIQCKLEWVADALSKHAARVGAEP